MVYIRYKLYNEPDLRLPPLRQVLYNRGIDFKDQDAWLNASWESINDWGLLDDGLKLSKAVNMVKGHVENNDDTCVVVDSD